MGSRGGGSALRIAYIINSLEGGGAAAPVPDVVRVLTAEGATVEVFALSRRNGLAAERLDAAGVAWSVSPAGKSQHLRAAGWLLGALRAFQPDVLWTSLTQSTVIGQLMGAALRIPVVSWQHNAFLKPANLALLKATRGLTTLWVADSECVAELTRERLRLTQDQVLVWPLFQARSDAPQSHAWRAGETFRFGSLGRLHANKGYDVLVEAVAELEADDAGRWPAFTVEVAGEGAERAALEALIRTRGVKTLHLVGFRPDPWRFLQSLHAYVQPSRAEGLCIAAHEALQAGLPVIAGEVGEMPRTIRAANAGAVAPAGDAMALAKAMADLLSDPAEARCAGLRGAEEVARRYSPEAFEAHGAAVMRRLRARARPG